MYVTIQEEGDYLTSRRRYKVVGSSKDTVKTEDGMLVIATNIYIERAEEQEKGKGANWRRPKAYHVDS